METDIPVKAGTADDRRTLAPVRHRGWWTAGGLALQAAGLVGVTAFLWEKIRHTGAGGHITAAMLKLVWHNQVHTRTGLAVVIACAAVYAAGSVVLARPYVKRRVTLFAAVPAAAIIGFVVLGILVAIVWLVIASIWEGLFDFDFDSGRRGRRRARRRAKKQAKQLVKDFSVD
ncbi:MAG: hypothetical protein J2P25_13130 [Nocardiopsaceae bacterium]|nr:hypothetical protein [Nocardiopsaceae bacterium]